MNLNPTKTISKPKHHHSYSDGDIISKKHMEVGLGNTTKRANQPGIETEGSILRRKIRAQHSKHRKVTIEQRRMDSLARLIEGASACSAVFSDGKKIFAASNALNESSQDDNDTIQFIDEVLTYYSQLAHMTTMPTDVLSMTRRMELFKKICVLNMRSQMASAARKSYAPCITEFAQYVLNFNEGDPLLLRNTNLETFAAIAGLQVEDGKAGMLFGVAVVVIPRLARDFKKFEDYCMDEAGKALFQEPHEIVKNGEAPKKGSKEDPKEKTNNLHAEMQIVQDIVRKAENLDGYIGISKLCCLDCISVILAIDVKNASDNSTDHMDEEIERECEIMVRGQHNIDFDNKWEVPKFLEKDLLDLYNKVKERIKKKYPNKEYRSMVPERSVSPPAIRRKRNLLERTINDAEPVSPPAVSRERSVLSMMLGGGRFISRPTIRKQRSRLERMIDGEESVSIPSVRRERGALSIMPSGDKFINLPALLKRKSSFSKMIDDAEPVSPPVVRKQRSILSIILSNDRSASPPAAKKIKNRVDDEDDLIESYD